MIVEQCGWIGDLWVLTFQLQVQERELHEVQQKCEELTERLARAEEDWRDKEVLSEAQQKLLEERVQDLTHQNDVLHVEAEKVAITRMQ